MIDFKERAKSLVMRFIRKTIEKVDNKIDLSDLRREYNKNTLRLFAINVTDLDYSAVINTTEDKLELIGEGPVRTYDDIADINLVVNLTSSTLFDIAEMRIDPLKAYLLGKITTSKVDENTFAADLKIVNEVFYYMAGILKD